MWLHFRWFFKHKLEIIDQLGTIGSGLCSRFSSTVKVLSLLSNTMLGFVTSGLAGERAIKHASLIIERSGIASGKTTDIFASKTGMRCD